MNYTENYHLPQWEETDRIMRTDFNEAMANIDGGIAETRNAAALAQMTADTARTEAAEQPYAMGSYVGKYDVIPVALGFRPKVILISKVYISSQEPDTEVIKSAASMYIDGVNCPGITFLNDGFKVSAPYSNSYAINTNGKTFMYAAFR